MPYLSWLSVELGFGGGMKFPLQQKKAFLCCNTFKYPAKFGVAWLGFPHCFLWDRSLVNWLIAKLPILIAYIISWCVFPSWIPSSPFNIYLFVLSTNIDLCSSIDFPMPPIPLPIPPFWLSKAPHQSANNNYFTTDPHLHICLCSRL